jgi:hypothetical protein
MRLYSLAIPALVTAVSIDAIPTFPSVAMSAPVVNGIVASDDGTLYFADGFHRTVWRLGRDGRLTAERTAVDARSLEVDAAGAVHVRTSARRVAASRNGDLVVATGSSLVRVSADGVPVLVAPGEPLLTPRQQWMRRLTGGAPHLTGVAIDAHGAIYVANASRGIIVRIGVDGRASVVDRSDNGWAPVGLAAARGHVFVLENGYGARVRRLGGGIAGIASWIRPARGARAGDAGQPVVL